MPRSACCPADVNGIAGGCVERCRSQDNGLLLRCIPMEARGDRESEIDHVPSRTEPICLLGADPHGQD